MLTSSRHDNLIVRVGHQENLRSVESTIEGIEKQDQS